MLVPMKDRGALSLLDERHKILGIFKLLRLFIPIPKNSFVEWSGIPLWNCDRNRMMVEGCNYHVVMSAPASSVKSGAHIQQLSLSDKSAS